MTQKEGYLDFDAYIRQCEPDQREKASIWRTAIGLQAVDGLQTSAYLRETAVKHIEGEINIDEARQLIKTYYQSKTQHDATDDDLQEADKVSANITKILSSQTLDISAKGYVAMHRRIFDGVFKHAGKVRDYNITKKEWVLDGDTVHYLNWEDLHRALDYDIQQERQFSYKGLTTDQQIQHITRFVSGIWHIGFSVENDLFAEHSWYFRNALVRANYKNAVKGIDYLPIFLERFFRNLLLGEQWELRNRYLHINPSTEWKEQPNLGETQSDEPQYDPQNEPQKFTQLSTRQQQILSLLRKDNSMSKQRLADALGLSMSTIKRELSAMSYVVKYVGPTKGGHWEIIEN